MNLSSIVYIIVIPVSDPKSTLFERDFISSFYRTTRVFFLFYLFLWWCLLLFHRKQFIIALPLYLLFNSWICCPVHLSWCIMISYYGFVTRVIMRSCADSCPGHLFIYLWHDSSPHLFICSKYRVFKVRWREVNGNVNLTLVILAHEFTLYLLRESIGSSTVIIHYL